MPDPKEHLVDAYSKQGLDLEDPRNPYHGVDNWQNVTLNEGDRIAQIEWRDPSDAQAPYSRYFTDASEVEKLTGPDGKVDMAAQSARLIQQTSVNYWVTYGVFKGNFSSLLNSELYNRFVIIRQ